MAPPRRSFLELPPLKMQLQCNSTGQTSCVAYIFVFHSFKVCGKVFSVAHSTAEKRFIAMREAVEKKERYDEPDLLQLTFKLRLLVFSPTDAYYIDTTRRNADDYGALPATSLFH